MQHAVGARLGFMLACSILSSPSTASIYVADGQSAGSGTVKIISANGSVATFLQGNSPQGITAMGGFVYVADPGMLGVFRYSTTAAPPVTGAPVTSGLTAPGSVTADLSTGNLYFTNGPKQVLRLGSNGTTSAFASMNDEIHGMAVDRGGNVYIAQTASVETDPGDFINAGRIERLTPQGVHSTFYQSDTLTPFVQNPGSMAFDAAGNLFIIDRDSDRIDRFDSAGVGSVFYTLPSGHGIGGLAFDAGGTLYASLPTQQKLIAFGPGATTPTDFVTTGLISPTSLTTDPPLALPEPTLLGPIALAAGLAFRRRHSRAPRIRS